MNKQIKKQFAFTLIELLVVIAIIGILSALIIVGMNSTTDKARIAKSQVFSSSLRNSLINDLTSEWKLDNGSGTTATDSWSGGNSGTLTGFANTTAGWGDTNTSGWMSSSNCISGTCLKFDGIDDYINCGSGSNLDITEKITISFWFKALSLGSTRGIISKMIYVNGTNKQGYFIRFSTSSSLGFSTQNNVLTDGFVSSITPFSLNKWYHIVETFDSGTMKIHIDGALNNQTINQTYPLAAATTFKIGSTYGGSENFSGVIDDIRVFSAAIPTSQIQQMYFAGLNKLFAKQIINVSGYQQRLAELVIDYAKN
ncbi:MAG: LamG-like jellyroll fold domain-containing protein [Candidatus Paceibacterota bacterium]